MTTTETTRKEREAITRTYREDDWVARVEVLEDNSDDEWERYRLRLVETLRESVIYKTPENGAEWSAEHLRDSPFRTFHLYDDGAQP